MGTPDCPSPNSAGNASKRVAGRVSACDRVHPTRSGIHHIVSAVVITCIGAALIAITIADVFYTVLFPASGRGPIRRPLSSAVNAAFGLARRLPGRARRRTMAYAGPAHVAATLTAWFVLLLAGWAAIYWPALGDGVVAASGATDRSWGTALYYSGYTLTTLGLGDIVAVSPVYRGATIVEAATGFVTLTLVISYFVSVYTTLTARNSFALALHQRTGGTGRGVDIVRVLWRDGPASAAIHLSEIAIELRRLVQTHSSYPVLRSFHYEHDYDALPRILQTCWETATLLQTAVAVPASRPELAGSSVAEIAASTDQMCVRIVHRLPGEESTAEPRSRWLREYTSLLTELRAAGVPVQDAAAADSYVTARASWEPKLQALAKKLLYDRSSGSNAARS